MNTWTTQQGDELKIEDLTDSHILNILRHFNNQTIVNDLEREKMLFNVIAEAKKRGIKQECHFQSLEASEGDGPDEK